MMNIAVIGSGYIGSETALFWKNKGHLITATTRTAGKIENIAPFAQEVVLLQEADDPQLKFLIEKNDVLLITVAAGKPEEYDSTYVQLAQKIREAALEIKTPKRLIYTSSTSVYGEHHGEWVDEKSSLKADTPTATALIRAEQIFESLRELGWQVTILRLAEIYGPKREISQRVAQGPFPGTGDKYTNMIHQQDCVAAIDFVLEKGLTGVFNLADDDHPTRKELYDKVASQMHLPSPEWDPKRASQHLGNKRISNHKIKSVGFAFKIPHRLLK